MTKSLGMKGRVWVIPWSNVSLITVDGKSTIILSSPYQRIYSLPWEQIGTEVYNGLLHGLQKAMEIADLDG